MIFFKANENLKQIEYGVVGSDGRYHILYCTINLINGKFYIGVLNSDRNCEYKNYLGSGTYLNRSIEKYGRNNFYRLDMEFYNTEKEVYEREADIVDESFIKKYRYDYYNMCLGGASPKKNGITKNCGWSVINNSPAKKEFNRMMSERRSGSTYKDKDPDRCKKHSSDMIGIKNPFYGKRHSEESKKLVSETKIKNCDSKGKNNQAYGKKMDQQWR